MSDDVRLVLPCSLLSRPQKMNAVDSRFSPVKSERLPDDTFPRNIKADYVVWAPGKRNCHRPLLNHSDWTWLPKGKSQGANLVVRASGTRAGAMYVPEDEVFERYTKTSYYIGVCAAPEVIERFRAMQDALIKAANTCNGRAHCGKAFMVSFYTKTYEN